MRTATASTFAGIDTLRETTRESALTDFGFFANHVLGLGIAGDECEIVQSFIAEDVYGRTLSLSTKRSNAVGSALAIWLRIRGHVVITPNDSFDLSKHETLGWLFSSELGSVGQVDKTAVINIGPDGLTVRLGRLS